MLSYRPEIINMGPTGKTFLDDRRVGLTTVPELAQ